MNPHVIRENLNRHRGERVRVQIFGMRNKNDSFIGVLRDIYPQIFTVETSKICKKFGENTQLSP